jgi:hypothetical protein
MTAGIRHLSQRRRLQQRPIDVVIRMVPQAPQPSEVRAGAPDRSVAAVAQTQAEGGVGSVGTRDRETAGREQRACHMEAA